MSSRLRIPLTLALLLLLASTASARVISYAPYTDRTAVPALQHRLNNHFVLVESRGTGFFGGIPGPILMPPMMAAIFGQAVLYDAGGAKEPRVIFPQDGTDAYITAAAVRERKTGDAITSTILLQTTSKMGGLNPSEKPRFILSSDSGQTWKVIDLPAQSAITTLFSSSADVGGPYARGRQAQIRIGNDAHPFAVAIDDNLYLIAADGSFVGYRAPQVPPQTNHVRLVGTNKEGSVFLVRTLNQLLLVSLVHVTPVATLETSYPVEGWITPDGGVYIERTEGSKYVISYIKNGTTTDLLTVSGGSRAFAVPTFDHAGAWILQRGPGKPTILYRHLNGQMAKQWEDVTAPEVEALHAGSSGNKLLIQVHRPRPQADQRIFLDPALAVWTVGQPAPRAYDELFMNEESNKGFVHLNVETMEAGAPFVFDSGTASYPTQIISPAPMLPPGAGGGDVVQEWGVVRASLKQRLVLPSVGRTNGAYGSFWVTDLIAQNPLDTPQQIEIQFVPNGDGPHTAAVKLAVITLAAQEIRRIPDALMSLFEMEAGVGALFITPQAAATVTSRTYSRTLRGGTYGFAMNAIDFYAAAASPRFPVTFSGALPGSNFRTNLVLTDTSGRGTQASVVAAGTFGTMGRSDVTFTAIPNGQQQINGLSGLLGLQPFDFGALVVRPNSGTAIASVFAVDNRTNDSTYFPPDLPSPVVRTIPVIGHVDGANNSRFRSDLYLFNPSAEPRSVLLQAKLWDVNENPSQITLTLLPYEAKVIPDVLKTAFGKTGLARLRYTSSGNSMGVRVTSRTYTIDDTGGTYGFLMPPLNNFQLGQSGDSLEILGAFADPDYRTNIGLVELTGFSSSQNARVRIEIVDGAGKTADSFEVNVPIAGGMQINDVVRARAMKVEGAFLIRVSPLNGTIGAYATVTDNRSNDSSYLAANLAARE